MKFFAAFSLAAFPFAYLGLCVYGIAMTGSTEGLADIGNAVALSTALAGLAAFLKRDSQDDEGK
ncbi:hypothetical protein [Mycolicibacterium lutetiense]